MRGVARRSNDHKRSPSGGYAELFETFLYALHLVFSLLEMERVAPRRQLVVVRG